ncbi:MAG: hypothetical protein M3R01_03320 [Actinomycetota bacterium]|nr:hypothetical protein [Actinomycetota bacterium]
MNPKRLHFVALATLFVLGLASCGGDDDGAEPTGTTAPAEDDTAADDTATDDTSGDDAGAGGDAEEVGVAACSVISTVLADLGDDAGAVAYLSQFAIAYSAALESLDPSLSRTALDSAAREECPEDHERFLDNAEITSLDDDPRLDRAYRGQSREFTTEHVDTRTRIGIGSDQIRREGYSAGNLEGGTGARATRPASPRLCSGHSLLLVPCVSAPSLQAVPTTGRRHLAAPELALSPSLTPPPGRAP